LINEKAKRPKENKEIVNEDNKMSKQFYENTNSFGKFFVKFTGEIIRYDLLKNKIYLVCLTSDCKLFIYNIFKCEKIFETKLKSDYIAHYESLLEIIKKFDKNTLKSWCQIDIKIGVITANLNKNLLNTEVPLFDYDYYEKIIEATNGFKKSLSENIHFISEENIISGFRNTNNNSSINNAINYSNKSQYNERNYNNNSYNDSIKNNTTTGFKKRFSAFLKNSPENQIINIGRLFIKSIFSTFVNDLFLEIKDFIGKNFVDKNGILRKNYIEEIKNKINFSDYKLNIDQDIFLYYVEDDNLKYATYLKDFKCFLKSINLIKEILPIDSVK